MYSFTDGREALERMKQIAEGKQAWEEYRSRLSRAVIFNNGDQGNE